MGQGLDGLCNPIDPHPFPSPQGGGVCERADAPVEVVGGSPPP